MKWALWLAFTTIEAEPVQVAVFDDQTSCIEAGAKIAIASGMAEAKSSDSLLAALAMTLKPICKEAN